MNEENRQQLLNLCTTYLETKPAHSHGFCWWAVHEVGDVAYDLVLECTNAMPPYAGKGYVAEQVGYNEVRAQFVSDLRDHLQAFEAVKLHRKHARFNKHVPCVFLVLAGCHAIGSSEHTAE